MTRLRKKQTSILQVVSFGNLIGDKYNHSVELFCDAILDNNEVPSGLWYIGSRDPNQIEVVFDANLLSTSEIVSFLGERGIIARVVEV